MVNSLFSALSGLQTHQDWISVIGNNIANANTPGFKSGRATFSSLFSQTLRFASLPTGNLGGRNPVQIGLGTQLADISRNLVQGALTNTGRPFDLALNGQGFFVVTDGIANLYTRVGTFGLDANSRLVDQRTGFQVLGTNSQPITLNTNTLFRPQASNNVSFSGNLPAVVTGPLAQELTTSSSLMEGTSAQMTGTIATTPTAPPAGQTWTMDLIVNNGAPVTVAVTGNGALVTADFVNAINALGAGVTASDAGGGILQLTTDKTGADTNIRVIAGTAGFDLATATGLDGQPQVSGTEFSASMTSDINLLSSNIVDYNVGDLIDIAGTDTDGTPVAATFRYGVDGTTIGDLVTFVDGIFVNASATFDVATGQILLTAGTTGPTGLSVTITETSLPPKTNWAQHAFTTTTLGTGPDTATSSIEVFDQAGTAHTMTFDYERQDDGTWNITPSVLSAEGTVISPPITGLTFNSNGSIALLPPTGDISIQFTGQAQPQTITLDFGTPSQFDGITQFGAPASVFADSQNGFPVGELASISVNSTGEVQGFYSNGQISVLGEIGIATFVNANGLREVSDNLFAESPNSGTRTLGKGSTGRAGEVVGGSIEGSNVEIAEEFVRLIEAQRGFQANARLVTTTDEVLAELVNLI